MHCIVLFHLHLLFLIEYSDNVKNKHFDSIGVHVYYFLKIFIGTIYHFACTWLVQFRFQSNFAVIGDGLPRSKN